MIGERLKQARELNDWTQEELAEHVGVKQASIALIERDALTPREELLQAIAEKTGFPRDFFDSAIETDFPFGSLVYRKFARMRADQKRKSHRLAQQAFELSEFFAARMKPIPIGLPRLSEDEDDVDVETAARITRNALGLDPTSPIPNLMQRLERIGVRVFMLPGDVPDLDAFSTMVGRRPVIALNPSAPGDRQSFSLAHETAHLVLHYPPSGRQEDIEEEADRFAAELLMPAEAMRSELTSPVTLSSVAELKARWRVSMSALIRRAKDLEVTTERQYKYLMVQMSQRGWRTREPVEIAAEKPRVLRKMAEVTYGEHFNVRRIAIDAKRPTFLVARLIDAAPLDTAIGEVLDFRAEVSTEALEG